MLPLFIVFWQRNEHAKTIMGTDGQVSACYIQVDGYKS